MPTSKKRVKKTKPEEVKAKNKTANIVKHPIGKVVIVVLSLGFVLSIVVGFIYVLVQAWNA